MSQAHRVSDKVNEEMIQATWESFARDDPMWFIASLPGKEHSWEALDFFQSGEDNVLKFLEMIAHPNPKDAVLLELGCGMGRLTFPFARYFKKVIGVDVSMEMIRLAAHRQSEVGLVNVELIVNDGTSLNTILSESIDVCFSFLCLQHVPTERILKNYILEMGRVLSRGGIAVFQLPIVPDTRYGALRQYLRTRLNAVISLLVRTPFLDAVRLGVHAPTYRGVRLRSDEVRQTARQAGLEVVDMTDTMRSWSDCYQTFVRCRKH